ncbi:MAG TPA: pitrilysin family protein [Planctomycetota bacterium]|nr:pitrilysin family protein [Planctomycetota bacterium]
MHARTPIALSALLLAASCESHTTMRTTSRTDAPAAAATDAGRDILPFEATETTFANGLKVIVVPTGLPNLVSLQIPVQTGSRNEVEAGKTGFAHFFEHMMFRGTEQYPPAAYEAIITKAGARQNAYTTDDYTNYHITFAKEDLAKILEIEADRFQHLSFPEEAFRTEARAVLGEYNKNFANPIQKLFEVQRDAAYTTHTYKHTTMGFIEDIEAMPDQMQYSLEFFDRWYRPEYTTVIVAGDVDPEQVIGLVEKYWGDWERGSYTSEIPAEPPPQGPVYAHVDWSSETLPWITVAFHGPAFSESEKDAAALELAFELAFGETSPLYQRLVVEEQKVDAFGSIGSSDKDPGLATVLARLKDGADAVYVRDAILATFEEMRREKVSEKRLAAAKSNLRYGLARTFDNTEAIASTLARFVHFSRSYDTLNTLFRLYESLTPDDLLAACREYLTDERMVVTTLSHAALPAGIDSTPSLASFAPTDEVTGAAAKVPFVVLRSPNQQLSVKFLFELGSADDPEGKLGLAALAADMVADAGSASMTYDEITEALFPVAGGFSAQVDKEMTVFNGSIHKDNLEVWMQTALEQLLHPGLREEDFTRVKEAHQNALVQDLRANNDEALGMHMLQAEVYAGTPYAHPPQGAVAGLESITLDDVRAFIEANYTLANLEVGLAGDVDEALEQRLRRALAALPEGESGRSRSAALSGRMPEGREALIVAKDTRATAISMGFPIEVTRAHPDYVALYLARTWLGEHRSSMSHLYQRIREVRGMNYGDYAYIEAFPNGMGQFFPDANRARRAQLFEIWIRPVKPEHAVHATKIALFELEALVRDGLTQEDFESTREYLSKNVFVMTSTQSAQLGYALDSRFHGIGEFTEFMRSKLAALTVDEVNAAIRRHLQTADMELVYITKDAEALRAALLSGEPSTIVYDAEKPAELLEEDRVIGAEPLGLTPERVRVVPVGEVFAR